MADGPDPKVWVKELLTGGLEAHSAEVQAAHDSLLPGAEAGDAESQALLGALELELGRPQAALPWFERAAKQSNPAALRGLGFMHSTGSGVRKDRAKAADYYRAAAEGGDVYAMYNLALLNIDEEGRYLPFDDMVRQLQTAAEAGLPEAAATLADMLARVDRDDEAVAWYTRAAEQGHTGAMYALGSWARDGIVGSPDDTVALEWFMRMFPSGDARGMHAAHRVARSMSDDDIRRAASRAGLPSVGEVLISQVHR